MIPVRVWQAVDSAAHFMYCPTMLGKRSATARWHHSIHLIPGSMVAFICDHLDRALGPSETELRRSPGHVPDEARYHLGDEATEMINSPGSVGGSGRRWGFRGRHQPNR